MRTLTHIILTACCLFTLSTTLCAQDRIPWITNFQAGRQMAERQQRLVLLHFFTDNCVPCQQVERNVFSRPEVIRAVTTGYIPIKINADQSAQLTAFYKVQSWPTDIVVDPSGREIFRSTTPQDANRYIAMLDSVKAHHSVGRAPSDAISSVPRQQMTESAARTDNFQTHDSALQGGDALASTDPPRQSSFVENPHVDPLSRELPRQPVNDIARPYGNPYTGNGSSASPAESSSSTWQVPTQTTSNMNPNGLSAGMQPNGSSQLQMQPQRPQMQSQRQPQRQQPSMPGGSPWAQQSPGRAPLSGSQPANQVAMRSNPSPQVPTGTHPPVALDGYSPVSLITRTTWVKGDPRWGAVHRGRTYLFSSPEEQHQFLSNPDQLSPILSGYDPVRYAQTGQLVEGKRQHGVFYRNRICLFADEAALNQFSQHADQFVAVATQAMQRGTLSVPNSAPRR